MESNKLGAVIYTRVSTGEQAKEGTSLESQRNACRAKALALGLPIVAEYEDAGISGGFLLSREGMQAALRDIQAGRAATLICANLSRYSRNVEHQQKIKKEVQAAGGRLIFCDIDFENTPEGNLAFSIFGGFAQYEKEVIRKRTLSGRIKKAEAGLQPSRSRSPFGYQIIGQADVLRGEQPAEMMGKYLIIEPEARIVRSLFDRYASGAESMTGLTRWLNATGVPTRQGGRHWGITTISYILSNPVYKGLGAYGRYNHGHDEERLTQKHHHTGKLLKSPRYQRRADPSTWITWETPAIVEEATWEAAQQRALANKRQRGGNPRRVRMLAGRVFCPECGAGLVLHAPSRRNMEAGQQVTYACCREVLQVINVGSHACTTARIPVARVETDVVAALVDAVQRPGAIQCALAAYEEIECEEQDEPVASLTDIEARLARLTEAEQATVKAQISGIISGADPSAYHAMFVEIAEKRMALERDRASLLATQKRQRPDAHRRSEIGQETDGLACLLTDLQRVLTSEAVSGDVKRDALGTVIEKVLPTKQETKIFFHEGVFDEETLQPYKRHWNTITLDGTVPEEALREMIGQSYELVVRSLTKDQRDRLRVGGTP